MSAAAVQSSARAKSDPSSLPTVEFLSEIPNHCDVRLYGFGLRVVLDLLDTVPGHIGSISASCHSILPVLSEEKVPGGLDPATLSTAPGGNCEGL